MSTKDTAVERSRGLLPQRKPTMRKFAIAVQIITLFLTGVGGVLSTESNDPLASATLIMLGGTPVLFLVTLWRYRSSMFSMGKFGTGKTRFCGFHIDETLCRWLFVVLIAATSFGINIAIPEADGIIGTGIRQVLQAGGPLLVGFVAFAASRQALQILLRVLIFGSMIYAADALNGSEPNIGGFLWAGVCALHFFTLMKALTAFGTLKNRDSGMTLANVIALVVMLGWAIVHDGMPTPDKFEGALLPLWVLYPAIPLTIMVIGVFGQNWTRSLLSEAEQAMLTSTAPVWGALAAFGLDAFDWAATPTLNANQVVGLVMVVLAALGVELYSAERKKLKAELAAAHAAEPRAQPEQNIGG